MFLFKSERMKKAKGVLYRYMCIINTMHISQWVDILVTNSNKDYKIGFRLKVDGKKNKRNILLW